MKEILVEENKFYIARYTYCYKTDFDNYIAVTWLELKKRRKILPDVSIKVCTDTHNNKLHLEGILRKLIK